MRRKEYYERQGIKEWVTFSSWISVTTCESFIEWKINYSTSTPVNLPAFFLFLLKEFFLLLHLLSTVKRYQWETAFLFPKVNTVILNRSEVMANGLPGWWPLLWRHWASTLISGNKRYLKIVENTWFIKWCTKNVQLKMSLGHSYMLLSLKSKSRGKNLIMFPNKK